MQNRHFVRPRVAVPFALQVNHEVAAHRDFRRVSRVPVAIGEFRDGIHISSLASLPGLGYPDSSEPDERSGAAATSWLLLPGPRRCPRRRMRWLSCEPWTGKSPHPPCRRRSPQAGFRRAPAGQTWQKSPAAPQPTVIRCLTPDFKSGNVRSAPVISTRNEPDPAKPESPPVKWPATPLPFGRREVSIKGRRPPDESSGSRYSGVRRPALASGVRADHREIPGHATHEAVSQARTVLDRD